MLTFHCNISGRIYGFPSVLAPHLTGTASVGVWRGCPCCRDNLTFTLPPLQPSREWLLIKCSSPHPQSNLRPEVLSGGLLSSAELSALCYCADRGKWQCSSLPLNDSVLIQPVSTPEQSNRKKKKRRKNNQNRKVNTHPLFGGIVTGGPFQKSPCHLFQGHTAICWRAACWVCLLSVLLTFQRCTGDFLGKSPVFLALTTTRRTSPLVIGQC